MSVVKDESGNSGGGTTSPPDLGLLEEDDEFEEFPAEGRKWIFYLSFKSRYPWKFLFRIPLLDWDSKEEDHDDVNVWEDNWDDDTVEDDFSVQLK